MSRRPNPASRSAPSGKAKLPTGPKVGRDGKVEVGCPQCGAEYRVAADKLDSKIECAECHRVFFAKSTAGKKVRPPDYTKAYVGFGILAVAIVGLMVAMSGGTPEPKKAPAVYVPKPPEHSVGTHPRTAQLVKWAQAVASGNRLVLQTHSDLKALGAHLGLANADAEAVLKDLQTNEATRYLRELVCDSGALASEADMTASSGKGVIYLTPKAGDATWQKSTRGELELSFTTEGEQVKVGSWTVKLPPMRKAGVADPSRKPGIEVNKDISKPEVATFTDSAGTRTVNESKPAAVPHWSKATPEQQKMADEVVAALILSANPEAPGTVFNRALARVVSMEDRKAVVPRVLNAMFELYGDVIGNHPKLTQLNAGLKSFTGFSVNYEVLGSGDAAKDKADRESKIRQWFAFWYRYANDLGKWFEEQETFEVTPPEQPKTAEPAKKPAK